MSSIYKGLLLMATASVLFSTLWVEAGLLANNAGDLIGLHCKPASQLGHTLANTCSTQVEQKVHSKVSSMASLTAEANLYHTTFLCFLIVPFCAARNTLGTQ
jgi:hypothetical protein